MTFDNRIGLVKQETATYPTNAPYHPPMAFPELWQADVTDPTNIIYQSVRQLFLLLGYDKEHFGTSAWNPLGWLVKQGDVVFLKPNMISHKHSECGDWDYVITHGSIIRVMVDYVHLALRGEGKIQIGDSPQTDSDFDQIVHRMGLIEIQARYKKQFGFEIEILDLRKEHWIQKNGVYINTEKLPGDPRGSLVFDIGAKSMFAERDNDGVEYYGAFYNTSETNTHHGRGIHEYMVSKSPIAADVFINLPKLKTHKKCGLTVNLKSLVGINANKNWLPHYVFGSPKSGGDQFAEASISHYFENAIVRKAKRVLLKKNPLMQAIASQVKGRAYQVFGENDMVVRSGNWFGNDTVWRMSLDLNRILLYGDELGRLSRVEPKRFFSLVDGFFAMEGNGPVSGKRREAGVLVAGTNPVAVDCGCAKLMGMDYRKLQMLNRAFEHHEFPLARFEQADIECVSNQPEWNSRITQWPYDSLLWFQPHFGWKSHIELDR